MARFSQAFLQSLTQPSYGQGLFDLGKGLAQAPLVAQQEKERLARQEQLKSILQLGTAAVGTQDPTNLSRVAQRLSQIPGMEQQALAFAQMAQKAGAAMAEKETTAKTGRGKGELMALANNPQFNIMDQKQQAGYLGLADSYGVSREEAMEIAMQSKKGPEERFKVVGNRIFDLVEQRFIEPSAANPEELKIGDLQKIATPASILKYLESGNKSDLEAITEEEPDSTLVGQLLATDSVLDTVDKAMGLTDDYWVVGYDVAKMLPTTDARELQGYVNTLQANLAFDRLQEMRNASKTGGALGQVSNIELGLLQSSVATLDPGSKNFKEQLAVVRRQYQNFRNSLLGIEPNDPTKYVKDPQSGKLYYILGEDFIDLDEAAKTGRFNLSPNPKTGGEF